MTNRPTLRRPLIVGRHGSQVWFTLEVHHTLFIYFSKTPRSSDRAAVILHALVAGRTALEVHIPGGNPHDVFRQSERFTVQSLPMHIDGITRDTTQCRSIFVAHNETVFVVVDWGLFTG